MPDARIGDTVVYESEYGPLDVEVTGRAGRCVLNGKLTQVTCAHPENRKDRDGNVIFINVGAAYKKDALPKSGFWHFSGEGFVAPVAVPEGKPVTAMASEELEAELARRKETQEPQEPEVPKTKTMVKVNRANKKGKKVPLWVLPKNVKDDEIILGEKQVPIKG